MHTAAIGPATAAKLRSCGLTSDIVPETYRAEAVAAAFGKVDVSGKKILLPRAARARPVLPEQLRRMGAEVDEVAAYRTRKAACNADELVARLEAGTIDLITFTSSSTVTNFKQLLPPADFQRLIDGVVIASIGPITAETARRAGFKVHITAQTYTIAGLCEALVCYFAPGES